MALKPQDVLVLLKVAVGPGGRRTFLELATDLGMSASEVHGAVRRCTESHFIVPRPDLKMNAVNSRNVIEFVAHGIRYVFPPRRGAIVRGMATAHAAPVLAAYFAASDAVFPVWPDPHGDVTGTAFEPLYRSVPFAARRDERLYTALALVDAIRGGGAREREVAAKVFAQVASGS